MRRSLSSLGRDKDNACNLCLRATKLAVADAVPSTIRADMAPPLATKELLRAQ